MKRALIPLVALLFASGCATPLPQTPPPGMPSAVAAPAVKVGDTWTYRVRDAYTDFDRGSQTFQVTEAGSDRIRVAVTQDSGAAEEQVYDREWSWLKRPATNLQTFDYAPAYKALAFPLAPGKRWQERVTARDPVDGRRFPVSIDGVVLGWERVKVPAGEFDALKIRRLVFLDYWVLAVRGRSEILEYDWYAPAVNQVVRRETTSRYLSYLYSGVGLPGLRRTSRDGNGGPRFVQDDWLIAELVSYSLR